MVKSVGKSIAEQIFADYPSLRPFVQDLIDGTDTLERMIAERDALDAD